MIKTYRPTSEGRRTRRTLISEVDKIRPQKSLTNPLNKSFGRNNGKISSRHRSSGHKKFYRVIDFKRAKFDIPSVVKSIEYDPNRGPNIALISYKDGEKRYILAPDGLQVGTNLISTKSSVEIIPGNCTCLKNIPLGTQIHNIEINIGAGGQIVRGAGTYGVIMAKEGAFVNVKLPSGEVKRISQDCLATIGILSNIDLRNRRLGKAGISRHLGNRPHIRGVAISNPSDHPHAGSYKDKGIGRSSPRSPWGWKTRGKKTRSRKIGVKYLVSSRKGAN